MLEQKELEKMIEETIQEMRSDEEFKKAVEKLDDGDKNGQSAKEITPPHEL